MKQTGNILLIEDEQLLMDICDAFLKKLNYSSLKAKTGHKAVKIAETYKGNILLALLDLGLPDMEGIDVYRKLIKARPSMKVIICSGYSENGPGRDILSAGADAFLQKPFSFNELSRKINMLIERRMEKRYKTRQDAVITFRHGLCIDCSIVDISRHGMAFCYKKDTGLPDIPVAIAADVMMDLPSDTSTLTINAENANFSLKDIQCISISDINNAKALCGEALDFNRHSILFKNPSYSQMAHIEEFMVNHSIRDA